MVNFDDIRLAVAKPFGATTVINNKDGKAVEATLALTGGRDVDTAIKAVWMLANFIACEDIVAPGGVIANIDVHGAKADPHLEKLWDRNISITTRLVDTVSTPMLLKTLEARKIGPAKLIIHWFKLDQILDANGMFGNAAKTSTLKVIIEA